MKTIVKSSLNLAAAGTVLLLVSFAGGCTLNGVDDEINNNINEDDLEAASQILGEALSSDNSGLMLSLNDAMTTVSSDGFSANSSSGTFQKQPGSTILGNDDSGRGHETNYSYSYDPETGIHTVSFTRVVDRPLFSKEVTDTLKYIFTDNNGAFIEYPRQEKERIESINFKSYREGSAETPRRTSSFVRTDTLLVGGVSPTSDILQIDGVHNSHGQFHVTQPDNNFMDRAYRLEINFLNIAIDKAAARDGLNQGVTGTLTWEMIIEKNNNGSESSKTLTGTIEMNGDGTALLRFKDFLKIFNINLNDGDVKDRDHEFEGRVVSVNLDRQSFRLRSGYQIYVNDQTEIDGDYTTLQQVREALQSDFNVWAEGEGYRDGNRFTASEVEFEREDENDGDDTNSEFEAFVSSVNIDLSTFTLAGDVVVKIDGQTIIDESGDYHSLQEVSDALTQGMDVMAEGEGVVLGNKADADLRALDVSFEATQTDGSGGEEED